MNKKDYRELVAFVSERFNKLMELIGDMGKRIDRLEQSTVSKADLEEVSERKKNEILGAIDSYAKRADDQKQEHDMLVGQVNRHEGWIGEIAKKTDVKLDY